MNKKYKELTMGQKVGILTQLLLTFAVLVIAFMSIGEPNLKIVVNQMLVIVFWTMAYNNQTLFKRKGFTIVNIVVGILFLIAMLYF